MPLVSVLDGVPAETGCAVLGACWKGEWKGPWWKRRRTRLIVRSMTVWATGEVGLEILPLEEWTGCYR